MGFEWISAHILPIPEGGFGQQFIPYILTVIFFGEKSFPFGDLQIESWLKKPLEFEVISQISNKRGFPLSQCQIWPLQIHLRSSKKPNYFREKDEEGSFEPAPLGSVEMYDLFK